MDVGPGLAHGNLGTTDETEAVRWLQLAADQGHVFAQRDMGMLYDERGQGVTQDTLEAFSGIPSPAVRDGGRAKLRRDVLAAAMLTPDQREAVAARPQGVAARR